MTLEERVAALKGQTEKRSSATLSVAERVAAMKTQGKETQIPKPTQMGITMPTAQVARDVLGEVRGGLPALQMPLPKPMQREITMPTAREARAALGEVKGGIPSLQMPSVSENQIQKTPTMAQEAPFAMALPTWAEARAAMEKPAASRGKDILGGHAEKPTHSRQYGKGNIDLLGRPKVKNKDGSISTVRSMSFNDEGKEILVPTVIKKNGVWQVVSDDEAIQNYYNTGEYLGKFDTIAESDAYAQALHESQDKLYSERDPSIRKQNSGSRVNPYELEHQIRELQKKRNELSASAVSYDYMGGSSFNPSSIDKEKMEQASAVGRQIEQLEKQRDQVRSEYDNMPFGERKKRWIELSKLQRQLTPAEKAEAKAAISALRGPILDRLTIPFSGDQAKKAEHVDNIALAGALEARTNFATPAAAGVIKSVPLLGGLAEKSMDTQRDVLKGSGFPGADYWPEDYNAIRYAPVDDPGAYTGGQIVGNVGIMYAGGQAAGALVKAVPGLSALPSVAQGALSTGLATGGLSAARKAEEGGDIGDVAKSFGVNALAGGVGSLASAGVGALGTKALFGMGAQNSVPAVILRDGLSGAAYSIGNMGTKATLDSEYRPGTDEVAKDAAVGFLFGTITSLTKTASMTREARARLDATVNEMKRDYAVIVAQSGNEVTADALNSLASKSAEVRRMLTTTQFVGQQSTVDGVMSFLDTLDDAVGAARASILASGPSALSGAQGDVSTLPMVPAQEQPPGTEGIILPRGAEGDVAPRGKGGWANSQTVGSLEVTERSTGQKKAAFMEEKAGLDTISGGMAASLATGKNNIIAKTANDIASFVKTALEKRGGSERLYMGTIPESTAAIIKSSTGMDVAGYTAILPGSSVQHIFKKHGNEQTEIGRGQRAVSAEDIAMIPQVLSDPDSVKLSEDADSFGRQVLIFEKQIGDNLVTAQAVTDGRRALTTDSLWVQKKKNPLVTTSDANVTIDPAQNAQSVPPSGSSYDITIPQAESGVKGQYTRTSGEDAQSKEIVLPRGEEGTVAPKGKGGMEEGHWNSIMDEDRLPESLSEQEGYWDDLLAEQEREKSGNRSMEDFSPEQPTPRERAMWKAAQTKKETGRGFAGTPATEKLGIKIERPITDLGASKSIRGMEKAKFEAGKALDKLLKDAHISEEERNWAADVAAGKYSMRQTPVGMNVKLIQEIVDAMKLRDSYGDAIKSQKARTNWRFDTEVERLIAHSDEAKVPSVVSLNVNTMQRNNERIWGKNAGAINAEFFDPVVTNEAGRIRFVNGTLEKIEKYSLTKEESALVQRLMEGDIKEEDLRAAGYDAEWLTEAAKTLTGLYGDFYEAANDFLAAHGYKEIGFQKNYAPHMQEEQMNTLQKYLQRMGFQTQVFELPTDIAGRTENFKPGKQYNPYFQHRVGKKVVYDAVGGLESYVNFLSNVIYHTDDIQKLRRLEEGLRKRYGQEELKARLDQLNHLQDREVNDELDPNTDIQAEKEAAYERYGNMTKFGGYVSVLKDYTNILAGKQSIGSRSSESTIGREKLNIAGNVQRIFARAAVVGNLSSAISQTVQLPQLVAEVGPKYAARAVKDVVTGETARAGFNQDSNYLTGKKGIRSISPKNLSETVLDFASKPFEIIDDLASRITVRAKYLEQVSKGKTHAEALQTADQYAARLMGSRMKGTQPVIFSHKGPLVKLFTTFQLEVANSWEHIVHDLPQEIRDIEKTQGKGAAAKRVAELVVGSLVAAFVANIILKKITGREPVPFDGIGMMANYMASGYGMTKEDYMKATLDTGIEQVTGERKLGTEKPSGGFDLPGALKTAAQDAGGDVPYLSNITSMFGVTDSRLPVPQLWNSQMSGAVKDIGTALTAEEQEKRDAAAGRVLPKTGEGLLNIGATWLPMGSQIKKTAQGTNALMRGGVYSGHGDNEQLKYPVDQTPANIARGMLFGRSALGETDRYYAEGERPLTEKQTEAYEILLNTGMPKKAAYAAVQELREVKKTDETSKQRGLIIALRALNATDEQKKTMYRAIITDGRDDEMESATQAGLPFDTYLDANEKHIRLNEGTGSASEKATDFAHWLDNLDLNKTQYNSLRGSFKFYSQVPNESTAYEKLVAAGVKKDVAYQLSEEIEGLTPEPGSTAVPQEQKGIAIANSAATQTEKMAALSTVLSESLYEKAKQAESAKIDLSIFLTAYKLQKNVKGDKDANGKTIALSASRNKKSAIDEVAKSLTSEQRVLLYEAFDISKEVWGPLGLTTGRAYLPKETTFTPKGNAIYMPKGGNRYMPKGSE